MIPREGEIEIPLGPKVKVGGALRDNAFVKTWENLVAQKKKGQKVDSWFF